VLELGRPEEVVERAHAFELAALDAGRQRRVHAVVARHGVSRVRGGRDREARAVEGRDAAPHPLVLRDERRVGRRERRELVLPAQPRKRRGRREAEGDRDAREDPAVRLEREHGAPEQACEAPRRGRERPRVGQERGQHDQRERERRADPDDGEERDLPEARDRREREPDVARHRGAGREPERGRDPARDGARALVRGRHRVVVQEVDRVVDRETEERRAEGERDPVELAVHEQPHGRGEEQPEDAGEEREQQALARAQREQQDRAHADERDARHPHRVAARARLAGHDVAVEPAALEHERAAVRGVHALERGRDVREQRALRPAVEARFLRREEDHGVAAVARDELPAHDAERVLRAGQSVEHAPECAERVGRHDLGQERRGGQGELAAQPPRLLAQSLLGEKPRQLGLRRVGEEEEAAREVGLVDLTRQLRVRAGAHRGERRVPAQLRGQRAARGDCRRLVGRLDREDHRAGDLGVAQHSREQRLLAAARSGEEVGDVGAEAEPRRDERDERREQRRDEEREPPAAHRPGGSPKSARSSSAVCTWSASTRSKRVVVRSPSRSTSTIWRRPSPSPSRASDATKRRTTGSRGVSASRQRGPSASKATS
jgi:hypothetical protein